MGAETGIQWTDRTFNPWRGCTKVSTGCRSCYAESYGKRFGVEWGPGKKRVVASESYWRQPLAWARAAAKAGKRERVFCASLADVLDEEAPKEAQARLWQLIRETAMVCVRCGAGKLQRHQLTRPQLVCHVSGRHDCSGGLDWQLLTKRPERWELIPEDVRPLVWLGTSISDQDTADKWIPRLAEADGFRFRFLSIEPQIGPVDLSYWLNEDNNGFLYRSPPFDWVIVGGESGHGARTFNLAWARSVVEQCRTIPDDGPLPVFVKQLGAKPVAPATNAIRGLIPNWTVRLKDSKGGDWSEWPADLRVRQFPEVRP